MMNNSVVNKCIVDDECVANTICIWAMSKNE